MNDANFCKRLGSFSGSVSEVLWNHLSGAVRQMICDLIAEEVTELCGRSIVLLAKTCIEQEPHTKV